MSIENVLKLAEHIDGLDPQQYNQRLLASCGTPSCIAGHAVYLAGYWGAYGPEENGNPEWTRKNLGFAANWLGLNFSDSQRLFTAYPLKDEEWTPTPQDAAWTLRHLAETGEVVWQGEEP